MVLIGVGRAIEVDRGPARARLRRRAVAVVAAVCGVVVPLAAHSPAALAAEGPGPTVYDAAGVYEYVVPEGVTDIEVSLVGAGGGGGGGGEDVSDAGVRRYAGASGGGGGGFVMCRFKVEAGQRYQVAVGGGGGGGGTAVEGQPADGLAGRGPHGGAGGTPSHSNGADTTAWPDGSGAGGAAAHNAYGYVRGGGGGGGGASLFGSADEELGEAPGGQGGTGAIVTSGRADANEGKGGDAALPGGLGGGWGQLGSLGGKGGAAGTCADLEEDEYPPASHEGEDGVKNRSYSYTPGERGGAGGAELQEGWSAGTGGSGGYRGVAGGIGTDGKVVVTPVAGPRTTRPRHARGDPSPCACSRPEGQPRTSVTTPAPTVRPPSRMAKRRPWSSATGWVSVTVSRPVSPGRSASTPSGSSMSPVMSVDRK